MEDPIKKKLKQLGITRLDPPKIIEIITAIQSGDKDFEIYKPPPPIAGRKEPALTTRKTLVKIKKLLKDGEMWLNKDDGGLELRLDDDPNPEWVDLDPTRPLSDGAASVISNAESQLNSEAVMLWGNVESRFSRWSWDLDHLLEIGFSEEESLEMLSWYHEYYEARKMFDANIQSGKRVYFRGMEQYAQVHWQAIFKIRHPDAPYVFLALAASYYVSGGMQDSLSTQAAGEDMLKYHVWKSIAHRGVYLKNLMRFNRSKTARNLIMRDVHKVREMVGKPLSLSFVTIGTEEENNE